MAAPDYSSSLLDTTVRHTRVANGTTYAVPNKSSRKNVSNAQSTLVIQLTNLLHSMANIHPELPPRVQEQNENDNDNDNNDNDDDDDDDDNDDDYEEADKEAAQEAAEQQNSGVNMFERNGRQITISAGVEANEPDYNKVNNVLSNPSNGSAVPVLCLDQKPKTYDNM